MSTRESERNASAKETLDILYDLSQLLNTGLDRQTLATCVGLVENGANPEALAAVIQELRREGTGTGTGTGAAAAGEGAGGGGNK